jgi:hypothetical protein
MYIVEYIILQHIAITLYVQYTYTRITMSHTAIVGSEKIHTAREAVPLHPQCKMKAYYIKK